MALPKAHRLKHWRDFQAVYQKGIRRYGRYLTLRGLPQRTHNVDAPTRRETLQSPNQDKPPTRIGISISQKVSKKAVVRNRIKRLLRVALRQLLPQLSPGWLLVVGVRPGVEECDYAQFLRELEQLLAEAEVLNGH